MNHKLELPIGASAEVFGKNVVCEKINGFACVGCVFEPEDTIKGGEYCNEIACTSDERTDSEFVILKPAE